MSNRNRPTVALCLALSFSSAVLADTFEITPADDVQSAINRLSAGDELLLDEGVYLLSTGLKIDVPGTAAQPTIIRAKPGADVLLDLPSAASNLVEIRNSTYVTFGHLRLKGGSHGIRIVGSDYITIEHCEVFETDDVAISANSGGTYEGLVIRGNHLHHTGGTGEGMYLGCNNDGCRVANSLIEENYIHHTNGPDVTQGDGIELKEGSYGNIIRDNVIHDTNYPGILTYSTVGNGAPNIIERNVIWNTADYAIQSAADSVIRNNIVLGGPIALQAHQAGRPSNITIVHNTIITGGTGIAVRDVTGQITIANNAVYSESGTAIRLISGDSSLVDVTGNVGQGGISGKSGGITEGGGLNTDFLNAHFSNAPPIDVFPAPGSSLIDSGSASHVASFDFNGNDRGGVADVGAYKYDAGGNPGWQLAPGFKEDPEAGTRPKAPTGLKSE